MKSDPVSVVSYQKPLESVRRAIDLVGGLNRVPSQAKVFIKPNIVFWTKAVLFPKFGVITTSRVVEDVVMLLKERGISDITIGEGTVTSRPKDFETPRHAFQTLGYQTLARRYGVKVVNVFERPFAPVDLGEGVVLNFNRDFLESDFIVDLPVMKTHAQTKVSLGIKNLKGLIDIESRKICHGPDPDRDLHFMVSHLNRRLPDSLTLIDGIFTIERGPSFDGVARRSNLLVASNNMLSADLVGARLLGYDPEDVPHLAQVARREHRPLDLSDVEVRGENIEDLASWHDFDYPYTQGGNLPEYMKKIGVAGLSFPKYDLTLCTYCSGLTGIIGVAILKAFKGKAFQDVEILTGKSQKPTPGMRSTVLVGKCMVDANRDHPDIREMIPIKGCPPQPKAIAKALRQAGIDVDPAFFENLDLGPGFFYRRYKDRPEFDENLFRVA